jgi:predicted transcriptional regulator
MKYIYFLLKLPVEINGETYKILSDRAQTSIEPCYELPPINNNINDVNEQLNAILNDEKQKMVLEEKPTTEATQVHPEVQEIVEELKQEIEKQPEPTLEPDEIQLILNTPVTDKEKRHTRKTLRVVPKITTTNTTRKNQQSV